MMKLVFALAAFAVPAASLAQANAVSLESKTFVARKVTLPDGKVDNKLFPPDQVLPGEALVFMLEYKNQGAKAATGFVINNPVPSAVQFTGAEQPWAVVSVDGGKIFGPLATLKVKSAEGAVRPANASDVTNVRWKFATPIAAGAAGRVTYYGMVK